MEDFCRCEGVCLCGQPKGRLSNPAVTAEGVRLAQLEAGVFEGGSPVPTAGDYAFLAGVRTPQHGASGERIQAEA